VAIQSSVVMKGAAAEAAEFVLDLQVDPFGVHAQVILMVKGRTTNVA
jgi:hypothetical protein